MFKFSHHSIVKGKEYSCLIVFMFFTIILFSQPTTVNFNYTGSAQNWVVPPCVTAITVSVAGAEGGGTNGGNGALLTGSISVTTGQTLQIKVGGAGTCPNAGYNGGGLGASANTSANGGCGGGGATDIRVSPYQINNRIIVAAGGGGMGGGDTDADGGAGGCSSGTLGVSPYGVGGSGGDEQAAALLPSSPPSHIHACPSHIHAASRSARFRTPTPLDPMLKRRAIA